MFGQFTWMGLVGVRFMCVGLVCHLTSVCVWVGFV